MAIVVRATNNRNDNLSFELNTNGHWKDCFDLFEMVYGDSKYLFELLTPLVFVLLMMFVENYLLALNIHWIETDTIDPSMNENSKRN